MSILNHDVTSSMSILNHDVVSIIAKYLTKKEIYDLYQTTFNACLKNMLFCISGHNNCCVCGLDLQVFTTKDVDGSNRYTIRTTTGYLKLCSHSCAEKICDYGF